MNMCGFFFFFRTILPTFFGLVRGKSSIIEFSNSFKRTSKKRKIMLSQQLMLWEFKTCKQFRWTLNQELYNMEIEVKTS